jgi:hypothetical protein
VVYALPGTGGKVIGANALMRGYAKSVVGPGCLAALGALREAKSKRSSKIDFKIHCAEGCFVA